MAQHISRRKNMRTEKSGWTAALLILQIAVGAMLAVGGI